MPFEMDFTVDPVVLSVIVVALLGLLIVYYYFLIGALVEMIRHGAPTVIIVFTYLSLIPFPLLLILGILNLIIWHRVRRDLMKTQGV